MPKSTEYIKSGEAQAFLFRLASVRGRNISEMSEFELFAFALEKESMEQSCGSDFLRRLLEYIREDAGALPTPSELQSRKMQATLWRCIYGEYKNDLFCENVKKYNFDFSRELNNNCKNYVEKYNNSKKYVVISLENTESALHMQSFLNTEGFCENILENIEIDGIAQLVINADNVCEFHTDRYHSDLCFKKIKCGEKCNNNEISSLLLWIIDNIILCRKTELILCGKSRLAVAEKMWEHLELLSKRLRLMPYSVSCHTDGELLALPACISPAVCICKEEGGEALKAIDSIAALCRNYPLGAITLYTKK